MTLVRWQPWREIDTLHRQLNRLLDDTFLPNTKWENSDLSFSPAAEIEETPETVNLKLEIPGMDAKDLDVQVTAEAVSISGERKSETKTEENGVTRSEFRYGKFQRVIPLPARVQNGKAKAEYKDGILTLNLPKQEAEKNKVVKIALG